MLPSFVLFGVLTILSGPVLSAIFQDTASAYVKPVQQAESSLQYVYAFFRHGIRSPLYQPYPNDPNKSEYEKYFPGRPGSLTMVGKRTMYDVGKILKKRYGAILGEYMEEKVQVSSTSTTRTIMTAQTIMAGLFPPSKPIFRYLKWQPIPVWQDTTAFDMAYLYNDDYFPNLALQVCPIYGELIREGNDVIVNPDLTKGRHHLYKLLQEYTGGKNINSVNTLYEIWDTLQFESLNGLKLPKWATEPQPRYNNRPLYPHIMQPVMVEWFLNTEYLSGSEEMLSFYSGPLFYSIQEHFKSKTEEPHSPGKMRFHVTHDTTLFVLLWALKLKEPATVGPGDGILFELHDLNEIPTIKIFYYDTNHGHSIRELILPQCPPPCSLEQFNKVTPNLTPKQWQDKCNA